MDIAPEEVLEKKAVMKNMEAIMNPMVERAIKAENIIPTSTREITENTVKTTMKIITEKKEDTKRNRTTKAAITANITNLERVTKEAKTLKRKDTKRDKKPKDSTTNLI